MPGEFAINSIPPNSDSPRQPRVTRGDGADAAASDQRVVAAPGEGSGRSVPVEAKNAAADPRRGREPRPDEAGDGPPEPKVKFQPPNGANPGARVFQREGDPPLPEGESLDYRTEADARAGEIDPLLYDADGRPPETERVGEQVDVLA